MPPFYQIPVLLWDFGASLARKLVTRFTTCYPTQAPWGISQWFAIWENGVQVGKVVAIRDRQEGDE